MSWSNRWIGKPSAVARAIDAYSDQLRGQSKAEYDSVKDALKSLVLANSEKEAIDLDANGHAYTPPSGETYASCQVTLKKLGALVD